MRVVFSTQMITKALPVAGSRDRWTARDGIGGKRLGLRGAEEPVQSGVMMITILSEARALAQAN